jgi:hypothetical protein
MMVDALLFKNVSGIAEVQIREANAGQYWAVKVAFAGMLLTRSRHVSEGIVVRLGAVSLDSRHARSVS